MAGDPKRVHDAEQGIAGWKSMGASMAAMYQELLAGGVQAEDAVGLVGLYVQCLFGATRDQGED